MLRKDKLVLKSDLNEMHKLEAFVEQISDVYNVNSTYYSNILVTLSEAVTNAIIHGNKEDKDKEIAVLFESKNKGLFFTIVDEGSGFDFENYPDPTDLNVEKPDEVGHGLYLMKSLTDEIAYDKETGAIELGFKISSINKELAVSRIKSLQGYFSTAEKKIKQEH